jgi:hypothetical protein
MSRRVGSVDDMNSGIYAHFLSYHDRVTPYLGSSVP